MFEVHAAITHDRCRVGYPACTKFKLFSPPSVKILFGLLLFLAMSHTRRSHSQEVYFGEEAFDKVTFSQMTQLEARHKSVEALQERVQRTQEVVPLTNEQRDKLLMAGQLDIHRFFFRYDQAKRKIAFGNVRRDQFQLRSSEAHASVHDLSRQFLQGLFGESSLLDTLLNTILDADSVAAVQRANAALAREAYAEQIDTAMLVIGRQVRLSPEKQATIREKLLEQTEPPAMFGTTLMPLYFVLAKMGEIEDELRSLFDERDWRTLGKLIEAGRTATR